MRVANDGSMHYCRWADKSLPGVSLRDTSPAEFFQHTMSSVRASMLSGQPVSGCKECYQMESHGKISGRQRQLLKIGVRLAAFEKTLASTPWLKEFAKGSVTRQMPQDWQIDLGNYCNGACVFCSPHSSSRLAAEFKKIGIGNDVPLPNWTDDPVLVQRFVDSVFDSPHIQYLHFIGGETVITPAFKTILQALIDAGLHHSATIGFTTNLAVWRDDVVDLLKQFKSVNLGMSVESFKIINDYVRYPVCLPTVFEIMDRWLTVAKEREWLVQFRITPTALTVGHMLGIYNYAWQHNIAVESCNFLNRPECLRPAVLPVEHRQRIVAELQHWVDQHSVDSETIINTRNPGLARQQLVQDLQSYIHYLKNEPDESYRLPDLVQFLKQLESNRQNSILDYLPEYEQLFRAAGY